MFDKVSILEDLDTAKLNLENLLDGRMWKRNWHFQGDNAM